MYSVLGTHGKKLAIKMKKLLFFEKKAEQTGILCNKGNKIQQSGSKHLSISSFL